MVDLQSYFPQIGSSGEKPPDGKDWSPGDNYFAAHLTYLWDQVRKRFGDVEDRLNAIDSDDDGIVDEADYANDANASTYKGNDIDSDGDGVVNNADNLGGNAPSYYATSSALSSHESDDTNPHSVSIEQARAVNNALQGILDMNSNDFVDGTTTIWDATNGYIPSAQVQGLDSHTDSTNNPHKVTLEQSRSQNNTLSGDLDLSDNYLNIQDGRGVIHEFVRGNSYDTADGIMIRPNTNPNSGNAIFRVLSSGGAERLRVEHSGAVKADNDLVISGELTENASI